MKPKCIVLALIVILLLVAPTSAATVLKLGHDSQPVNVLTEFVDRFAELVEEYTNGEVRIQVYGGGQLGSAVELWEQVELGTIDMSIMGTPVVRFIPEFGVFDLPFLFRDRQHAYEVLWGPIGEEFAALFEDRGLILLTIFENGFRQITNNVRPIEKPEDLQGIKLRIPESEVRRLTFATLGASPVPMPALETYTAIQQGVVDGQENPLDQIQSRKFAEVQKYLSMTNHIYGVHTVPFNKARWDSLSPEVQEQIKRAARQASEHAIAWGAEADKNLLDEITKATGIQVNYPNVRAFQEAARAVWDQFPEWLDIINKIVETGN
jgi:tripartite ATP-independent transporter DctP family solute receptor